MIEIEIPVKKSADAADLAYPRYATAGASGVDLLAAVKEPLVVQPFEIVLVPTGLTLAIPEGYEGQVRPRSGLALKHGVSLVNSPGTIDADYRGEVGVILTVVKNVPFTIERGMRIAQLVFAPVVRGVFTPTERLGDTARGAGGFGHTGSG